MSKEKLYAVKNDEGKYWSFNDVDEFWQLDGVICPATLSEAIAKYTADEYGGHVVTLIEEPEKVDLTKEQAKIVEDAHCFYLPARYISINSGEDEEELLINAYVNGYTVAKEKKYNVKVPHTSLYYWKKLDSGLSINDLFANDKFDALKFTEAEIEYYGLQDCEKVEVTDDD